MSKIVRIKGGTDNWIRPSIGHLYSDWAAMERSMTKLRAMKGRMVYYGHGKPTKMKG